jgi:hypothetical protein
VPGPTQPLYASGTAFFVGPKTLLTAAHIVSDRRHIVVAQFPGTLKATRYVERLFQKHQAGTTDGIFECRLVDTLHPNADISVLEVVGSYRAENYIHVKRQDFAKGNNNTVDIIGYPGTYKEKDIEKMHPSKDCVDTDMVEDVEELFPKRQLLITHGSIVFGGIQPSYRVSTVTGMSGASVLKDGNVIGRTIRRNARD